MTYRIRKAGAAIVLAAVLSACSGSETAEEPAPEQSRDNTSASAPVTTPDAEPQPALPTLPKAQTLDLQAAHPNGTTVRVSGVSFHDDHIQLDVTATNGGERTSALARHGNELVDDQNVRYKLSPPPSNQRLELAPGSSQQYKLVYLGRVSKEAQNLTLVTNGEITPSQSELSTIPSLRVGPIPVQR